MQFVKDWFIPNKTVSQRILFGIALAQIAFLLVWWAIDPIMLLPTPSKVFAAYSVIWREGVLVELGRSVVVNVKGMIVATVVSLSLSYLTVVPFMRSISGGVAKLRFLGLTGLTLPFTLIFGGGQPLKVAIVAFGMTVFFVVSMNDEVANIPKSEYDYARTLRMSPWRVVWEVVVLGKADKAFDILRSSAAIGWMMVTMVEGIVRSEGGVGAMLLSKNRQLDLLPQTFAILSLILLVGYLQDMMLFGIKRAVCPYANLTLERKS